jgi:hypothetical protein
MMEDDGGDEGQRFTFARFIKQEVDGLLRQRTPINEPYFFWSLFAPCLTPI